VGHAGDESVETVESDESYSEPKIAASAQMLSGSKDPL